MFWEKCSLVCFIWGITTGTLFWAVLFCFVFLYLWGFQSARWPWGKCPHITLVLFDKPWWLYIRYVCVLLFGVISIFNVLTLMCNTIVNWNHILAHVVASAVWAITIAPKIKFLCSHWRHALKVDPGSCPFLSFFVSWIPWSKQASSLLCSHHDILNYHIPSNSTHKPITATSQMGVKKSRLFRMISLGILF